MDKCLNSNFYTRISECHCQIISCELGSNGHSDAKFVHAGVVTGSMRGSLASTEG